MGKFNIFKKKSGNKKDSTDRYVIRKFDAIINKFENGDTLENLNEYERTFFITQVFETEVSEGGFTQFLCSPSGDLSDEIVQAFMKIGAFRTANLCKKALAALGGEIPSDINDRINMIDQMPNDESSAILDQWNDMFHSFEEDLNAINYAYLIKNKEYFE